MIEAKYDTHSLGWLSATLRVAYVVRLWRSICLGSDLFSGRVKFIVMVDPFYIGKMCCVVPHL